MRALVMLAIVLLIAVASKCHAGWLPYTPAYACPQRQLAADAAYTASAAPIEAEYRRDAEYDVVTAQAVYEAQMVSVRMAYDEAMFGGCVRLNNNGRR